MKKVCEIIALYCSVGANQSPDLPANNSFSGFNFMFYVCNVIKKLCLPAMEIGRVAQISRQ
jgi:hypothetical protein